MYGNLDNSREDQNLNGSARSLLSEAESEVGSLLSGLSQARKIPDRRKLPSSSRNKNGRGLRSQPPSSIAVKATNNHTSSNNGLKSSRNPVRKGRPNRSAAKLRVKEKNEAYQKDVDKIIKIQAFARAYISRFAYQSRLTMERTKQKFFAIQIQSHVRGFLQRQKVSNVTGRKVVKHNRNANQTKTASSGLGKRLLTGLGSPKPIRRPRQVRAGRNTPVPPTMTDDPMGSDSEKSKISIRMERLTSHRMDRLTRALQDEKSLGESESDVGSIMSNLSVARRVPDRRKKREEKENNSVKIQAVARGYIQRMLYRSMLAMENTKQKYFAITIQAQIRGHLQRSKGPRIKQEHTAPLRERISTQSLKVAKSSNSRQTKKQKQHDAPLRQGKDSTRQRKRDPTKMTNDRKPTRHHSTPNAEDNVLPRELTIRRPRRNHSESDESGVPVKQLTIRKPARPHSDSEESGDVSCPRHVLVVTRNAQRNGDRRRNSLEQSPPRKIMLRVKQPRNKDVDTDRSEASVDQGKAVTRRDRLMHLGGGASEQYGESESDMGSLMSGLSQARKVPDRRRLSGPRGTRGKQKSDDKNAVKASSAIKIQAAARSYIQRFAFKSRLIMEQSKNKFFAIQIQAIARGFLERKKLSN